MQADLENYFIKTDINWYEYILSISLEILRANWQRKRTAMRIDGFTKWSEDTLLRLEQANRLESFPFRYLIIVSFLITISIGRKVH